MEDKIVKPITNEPQKITPKVAMTKWMMFVAQLPKDHPDYQAQQDIQALVYGAAMASVIIGIVIGAILVTVF